MSKLFKREDRYVVIKLKDLASWQREGLEHFLNGAAIKTRECAVVESDWPEYEPVWAMIEARMTGANRQRHLVGDSSFESWFADDFQAEGKGTKQQMREAYEAGMNDPSVRQRNAAGVLVKNLEGLQTQWTAKAPSPTNDYRGGLHDAYELCSKDLAELIAEYKA